VGWRGLVGLFGIATLRAGTSQSGKLVLQETFCVSSDRKQGVKDKRDSC
jgi:hypothetical protein